jgi:hypothetical protein
MQKNNNRRLAARQPIDLFPPSVIWQLEVLIMLKGSPAELDALATLNTLHLN